jgi:hypothetical protein
VCEIHAEGFIKKTSKMKKGYWCKQRELVTILQEDRTHYLIKFFNGMKICTDKNAVADIFTENNFEQAELF